jgi:hypothetical protein
VSEKGMQVEIIDFQNITGETADHLLKCIMDVMEKFHLTDKIVSFYGNNCNTNFGGPGRKGTNNISFQNSANHCSSIFVVQVVLPTLFTMEYKPA